MKQLYVISALLCSLLAIAMVSVVACHAAQRLEHKRSIHKLNYPGKRPRWLKRPHHVPLLPGIPEGSEVAELREYRITPAVVTELLKPVYERAAKSDNPKACRNLYRNVQALALHDQPAYHNPGA